MKANRQDAQPTLLYAVRHGETEWNLAGRQQGHLDSPLTDRGVQQADALAEGLADRGIDVIYSSDLGRARRTAEAIAARLGLPVRSEERLRERHLGVLQGLTRSEFEERYPDEFEPSYHEPEHCIRGGESGRQGYERSVACVEDLAAQHRGQTVLLVTHGGVLYNLFLRSLSLPLRPDPRRFSLFNAAINRFSIRAGAWLLDTWGETAHLEGMEALDDN